MSDRAETPQPLNEFADPSAAPERRLVLRTAGLGGGLVAAALLTGCGSSGSAGDSGGSAASDAAGSSAAGQPSGSAAPSSAGSAAAADGVPTSKVPVGSGIIDADRKAVITQPTAGDFKAFTNVCTHQQCAVTQVQGEKIMCPCHGSQFSIKDGSVLQGPADKPLAAKKVTVQGSTVVIS